MMTPPVQTRPQTLPFGQLSWQHFEQLCLRLVRLDQSVEHTQSYGVQGDEQGGIDVYARHRDTDRYTVYQCKNEQDFGPAKIKAAVDVFLRGEWAKTSSTFVLCSREPLACKVRADAVEAQAKRLRKRGITFVIWDEIKLGDLLKDQSVIVDDFFGRPWAKIFCGEEAAQRLGDRITAAQSEADLSAYSTWLTERMGRVIYRGFANRASGERAVELPLERVYVAPLLLPEDERDAHQAREREIVHQLQDPDLDPAQLAELEAEFRVLKMGDWQKTGGVLEAGWNVTVPPTRSQPQGNPLALEEVFSTHRQCVVLGAPGSGKSTLLRWLALLCVRTRLHPEQTTPMTVITADAPPFPVLIALAAFANERKIQKNLTLSDFIQAHLQSLEIEDLPRLYGSEFRRGTCWILLDGIDEIAEADVRADVVRAIESFLAGLGDNRCLVTSRLHGYERVTGVPHFHLQPLTVRQVGEFIFNWNFSLEVELNPERYDLNRGRENGESLIDQLNENATLGGVASNPLLLVALLLMHRQNQALPQSRVAIYHAMTQTLLDTWNLWRSDARYHSGGQILTALQLRRVLAKVALWSRQEKPRGILRRGELQRRFVTALEELAFEAGFEAGDVEQTAQSYLQAAVEQAGLLEERAPGIFAFWHPTFEEFLAAYELVTPVHQATEKLLPLRSDPYWREVILLAVGLIGTVNDDPETASDVVRALARFDVSITEPILHAALRLGVACIAETPGLNRALIGELLRDLVEALTRQPYDPLGNSFLEVAASLPRFKPDGPLVEALGELATRPFSLGAVREAAYRLLANAAAENERAEQLCLEKFEAGLDQTDYYQDVMARFHATIGCMRAGHCGPFALSYLTGTNGGILHIARAVELLDIDQRVPTTDPEQRRRNLEIVTSVLNRPIVSPELADFSQIVVSNQNPSFGAGTIYRATPDDDGNNGDNNNDRNDIAEPLSAALLLLFAGDRSQKVYEVLEEAVQSRHDSNGMVFDAAHAPLMFGFEDVQATVKLQRQALFAFRRWFKHPIPERRLHAANETLTFLEAWEARYGPYIDQAPEFQGRAEAAKTEKFIEAYNVDRRLLRGATLRTLKSCLHVPDGRTRLIASKYLLQREQMSAVVKAVNKWSDKWLEPTLGEFHPFEITALASDLSETPAGTAILWKWARGENDWLKAIASGALLSPSEHKGEAMQIMFECLNSPHDEIRSALGRTLALFDFVEGKPLSAPVEAALRSCLGSEHGDASRNAAAALYQSGFREEELLVYLSEYLGDEEVEARFDTFRALQENDAHKEVVGSLLEIFAPQDPSVGAAFEKVETGQRLEDHDVTILASLIQHQPGEDPKISVCRYAFYDWVWFKLEAKTQID